MQVTTGTRPQRSAIMTAVCYVWSSSEQMLSVVRIGTSGGVRPALGQHGRVASNMKINPQL